MKLSALNHHAYCLVGGRSLREDVISTLAKLKIKSAGNPDFFDKTYETFTINDARELKSQSETRPTGNNEHKIFLITTDGIATEAQNALLKLFEEPSEYAHFFLIVPSAHLLLPTLKSRMFFLDSDKGETKNEEAEKFLKMSLAKRLEFAKSLAEDVSKEKRRKQDIIGFLDSVQSLIRDTKGVKDGGKILETIGTVRGYAEDRAPSLKMLLEYLALSI